MRPTTLCFPVRPDGKLLLGRKKRGFGVSKWNGFGGKIEAAEFIVPQNWAHNDETIKEMNLKSNLIVACIIRSRKVIYPHGDDCINSGDNVVIVTAGNSIKELHDIFKLG